MPSLWLEIITRKELEGGRKEKPERFKRKDGGEEREGEREGEREHNWKHI
jgi:hypothetical protein